MNTVERIIDKFGSLSKMANALGHKNPTTVQGWKERGVVPSRQIPAVIDAARKQNIDIGPADFFDIPDEGEPEVDAGSPPETASAA